MKVAEEREEERKVSKAIINYANNYNTDNIINNIHVNNRAAIKEGQQDSQNYINYFNFDTIFLHHQSSPEAVNNHNYNTNNNESNENLHQQLSYNPEQHKVREALNTGRGPVKQQLARSQMV